MNNKKVYIALNYNNNFILCDKYTVVENGNWIECVGVYNGKEEDEKFFTIPMSSILVIETAVQ